MAAVRSREGQRDDVYPSRRPYDSGSISVSGTNAASGTSSGSINERDLLAEYDFGDGQRSAVTAGSGEM